MRFGLLTQWYPPEPGPAGLPGVLARGLVERGHRVQVLTGFPNYPTGVVGGGYRQRRALDEVVDGVAVRRVPLYPSHDGSGVKRALNYGSFAASALVSGMDAFAGIDALWVNYSPVTVGLPMIAQRLLRRTPTIVHALDLWPDTLFASGFAGSGRAGRAAEQGLAWWCGKLYDQAARVAYISPGVGQVLIERGVDEAKLAYAPMWADEDVFTPLPTPSARDWGLRPDDVALVYAGTLGGAQGLETLVDACARLTVERRFRCLIAGSGVREQGLQERAIERGASNVQFLGRVDRAGIAELMAAGDVHYLGLNDHRLAGVTMPSKLQATLACARPLVASVSGDAAAVLADSDAAWIAPPGDVDTLEKAIRVAIELGREGLTARGRAGRTYYDHEFSVAIGVDRIERLLVDAAEGRS